MSVTTRKSSYDRHRVTIGNRNARARFELSHLRSELRTKHARPTTQTDTHPSAQMHTVSSPPLETESFTCRETPCLEPPTSRPTHAATSRPIRRDSLFRVDCVSIVEPTTRVSSVLGLRCSLTRRVVTPWCLVERFIFILCNSHLKQSYVRYMNAPIKQG